MTVGQPTWKSIPNNSSPVSVCNKKPSHAQHTHVVKQHFTTRHMYPNPYPRSIAATTYSKCYVPKFIRKNFPCDKR